ncbi:C3HC zinc finger-like-domain-containing protein [Coprinopsis sp. MPI-PUGE-AT-0042]|nr:C3HC zinc finger-like-domain-containing protein [Coprinopsis sp. MPI-PUGE-AT-0042]
MNVVETNTQGSSASPDNSLRARKRKLEDAFHTLDSAVQDQATDRPSAPKRSHTVSRSLYSTLAKYGVKSKDSKPSDGPNSSLARSSTAPELGDTAKKTPHLTAILSRAATRTKNAFSFKFNPSSPLLSAGAEYRPSSLPSFLLRLETFKVSTWANKPACLDPVAASRCGWTNDGKDRLVCGLCQASWVASGREGMSKEAGNALIEKQRQGLVDNHKNGCPWRTRQCDPSIYCIPLKSPSSTVKDVKTNAIALDALMEDVSIRHPLTPNQLNSLKKTVKAYQLVTNVRQAETHSMPPPASEDAMEVDVDPKAPAPEPEEAKEPSEVAVVASLFGWSIVPPAPAPTASTSLGDHLRRTSTTIGKSTAGSQTPARSLSRAGTPSRGLLSTPLRPMSRPSTPRPTLAPVTPARSRRSSFGSISRAGSPALGMTPRPSTPLFRVPSSLIPKRENTLLHCQLCQRRIGLWAFVAAKDNETGDADGDAGVLSSPVPNDTLSALRPKKPLPQRQFDLLKEHRSYCPYVVKSTVVPSLPSYNPNPNGTTPANNSANGLARLSASSLNPNAPMEGWRAVLTVLLRCGMAQRQRAENDVFGRVASTGDAPSEETEETSSDLDNVKAMMAGVKRQGPRDLLKYVKGLLG